MTEYQSILKRFVAIEARLAVVEERNAELEEQMEKILQPNTGHIIARPSVRQFFDPVVEAVCAEFQVPRDALLSRDRRDWLCFPRMVCYVLVRELSGASLDDVARLFKRDHTAVCYAEKAVKNRVEMDAKLAIKVAAVRAKLSTFNFQPSTLARAA